MSIHPRWRGASLLAALLASVILPLAATSPRDPSTPPIVDARGDVLRSSIASLEPVAVNGTTEWLLIRGKDIWNPVVLCLDPLPGASEMPLHRRYASQLEERFVVVGWDPRGTGKSYTGKPAHGLFVDQYVSDAIEVARRLKDRFRQDRIYLVGQGFGAVVGTLAAQRAPELFHALVVVDPIVNAGETEQSAYEFAITAATEIGDATMQAELARLGRPPYAGRDMAANYAALRESLARLAYAAYPTNEYRRTRLVTLAQAPEYSAAERRRLSAAETETFSVLYPQLLALHLDREVPALEVPTYFVVGRHDVSTGPDAAHRYYDALRAPRKGWVWFEQSGRSPMHEEPERFLQVLTGTVVPESSTRGGQTH